MSRPVLFLISFVFLSLLIGINLYHSYQQFGELVYPLDDAYIHMAISRNLQQHGIWGVTRFVFSSTSSSILYTLLLSASFALFGIKVWLPLAINWLVAAAVLWLLSNISLRMMNSVTALFFNLVFVALVPLSGMAMLGMEHCLQIYFCLLFFWLSYRKWNGEQVNNIVYGLTALLAVATRYESVFLIGWAGAVWLFVFRAWKPVLLLVIASSIPVLLFGLYAMAQGGFFVPNSLLAKSNYVNSGIAGFIAEVCKKILFNSLLASLVVIPFAYWLLFPLRSLATLRTAPGHLAMLIVALTAVTHQVFASFGWMFRYEAYLVAILMVGIAVSWTEWKAAFAQRRGLARVVIFIGAAVILFPLLTRIQIPQFANRAMNNIHDQQLQMARFVQKNFPSSGIAMNDIGTTTFFNDDMRLFDMEGLGTLDVLKIKKQFDSTWLKNYAIEHDIEIGIFYPHLYKGKIPASWELVGTWEIPDRFVAAGSKVGFFAIKPGTREKLLKALEEFGSQLPPKVSEELGHEVETVIHDSIPD